MYCQACLMIRDVKCERVSTTVEPNERGEMVYRQAFVCPCPLKARFILEQILKVEK